MPPRSSPARPIVLSLGGSALFTGADDGPFLIELADLLRRLGRHAPLAVTVGGGPTARQYIALGREMGLTEIELDEIGIDVTRLHARLLAGRIGPPTPSHPPTTIGQAASELRHGSPVILGGTEPGHTTDGVAAMLAVRLRAPRVVNATSVEGVYDHDPRANPKAKRYDRLSWERFLAIVRAGTDGRAGQEFVFDRPGAELLARVGIPLLVVKARNLANLEAAVTGRPFDGTTVGA